MVQPFLGGIRMTEDYYSLLGVNKTATKDEIKAAFRKLAMKYHPDKNSGDKAAEEKFKKINEAYAVLSNDEKRKQYDMFGAEGFSKRYTQEDIFRGFDFNGIFKEFGFGNMFGGDIFSGMFGGGQKKRRSSRGSNPFNFETNFGNQGGFNGHPGGFGNGPSGPSGSSPQVAETDLHISLEDAVMGIKKRVSIDTGGGAETIEITIPRGIESGKKLRLKGKGTLDPYTQQRGDLFCKIIIDPHRIFTLKGNDLIVDVEVKLTDMILGGKVRITTIDNQEIELKVPPHSKNNSMLRVKGKGMPGLKDKPDGNLLIRLQAKLPTTLDENQEQLFRQLADTGI